MPVRKGDEAHTRVLTTSSGYLGARLAFPAEHARSSRGAQTSPESKCASISKSDAYFNSVEVLFRLRLYLRDTGDGTWRETSQCLWLVEVFLSRFCRQLRLTRRELVLEGKRSFGRHLEESSGELRRLGIGRLRAQLVIRPVPRLRTEEEEKERTAISHSSWSRLENRTPHAAEARIGRRCGILDKRGGAYRCSRCLIAPW